MEITREEYLALTKRIEELEKERALSKLFTYKSWAYAVNELPIENIRTIDSHNDAIQLYYSKEARDTWLLFSKIAKFIHAPHFDFRAEYQSYNGFYWRQCSKKNPPTRYMDLTDEQKQLSLEMLNELIPIYNKYYKMAHPGAWVTNLCGKRWFQTMDE